MTEKLLKAPKKWLTLDVCSRIFVSFRKTLENLGEPIPPFETRYKGSLEGILESVKQTFGGQLLNSTVMAAAAAYFNQIIRGHPFKNGNKRMAVLFTHYFLLAHQVDYSLSYNEMFNFALTVAIAGEQGISSEKTLVWSRKIIEKFTEEKKSNLISPF